MRSTMRHQAHRRRSHVVQRHLMDRCTIQRPTTPMDAENVYEQDTTWAAHLSNVACLLTWEGAVGEQQTAERTVVHRRPRVILPHGADVTTNDRISSVIGIDGRERLNAALDIEQVQDSITYLVCECSEVS